MKSLLERLYYKLIDEIVIDYKHDATTILDI